MNEIYSKLNFYLNEICKYLERENGFLLANIREICILNDAFLEYIQKKSLDANTFQNHLTYEEVYQFARKIIAQIDPSYLQDFDCLIQNGELDFDFEQGYDDSCCISEYQDGKLQRRIININREFNYHDVVTLIHEFIHYTNCAKGNRNRNYFSEFLSIYFELYTTNYLLQKGINKEEIDYFDRLKSTREHSISLFQYEIVLLAFLKFGNLDDHTVSLLQQYFLDIQKETFEKECTMLYRRLNALEEKHKDEIKEDSKILGYILSEEFMTHNYKYFLGTILAFYAYQNANFSDIVYLNNHIHEMNDKSVYEICLSIGIDLNSEDFKEKVFIAIDEYIQNIQIIKKKGI